MKYILSILCIVAATALQAQDVRVTVDCPHTVQVGEPFQMAVQVNANATAVKLPEMSAFTLLRNYGRSQTSRVSFINGKITQSIEVAFNYIMQASQEGTLEIGAIEVTVDGKTYQSAPVTIQALAGNAPPQQPQGSAGSGTGTDAQQNGAQVQSGGREVFAEVLTDRRQVYQGEYINATVKMFSTLSVSSINSIVFPTFDGFFKQEIDTPPLHTLEEETINGVPHLTGVLRRYVLFPQKSGTLTIQPATMEVGVTEQVQSRSRSIFDDFFGGGIQTVPRQIASRPVNITVLPLPDGKPASFTGGVGQITLETSISKTSVKAHEPVTLKITVSGNGNLRFTDAPRINFPPDFEVYDPKITTSLNAASTSGSKTFEYLIIPRHDGTYRIPATEFSWFDPQTRQYKTQRSEEYTLTVERGDDQQQGAAVISGVTREDVQYLGQDIRYLKTGNITLRSADDIFFGTWAFWMWYLIPAVAFTATVYLRRKYIRKYASAALVKNRKASRYAARRLKQARSFMAGGQKEPFYEELSRALWGYLGDKLNIPVAELSKDSAKTALEQHGVDAALADEFTGVIDDCEFARYAPAAGADMNTLYGRAENVINRMQKSIQQ